MIILINREESEKSDLSDEKEASLSEEDEDEDFSPLEDSEPEETPNTKGQRRMIAETIDESNLLGDEDEGVMPSTRKSVRAATNALFSSSS